MRVEALANWIKERHAIYLRKADGQPKPWTTDPILRDYRFCNVYRELDKVTQWIANEWREPHKYDSDVWFAMAVARLVNWPPTLERMGYPIPWNPKNFIDVIDSLVADHQKAFTGVYIVPAKKGFPSKAQYLAQKVLDPLYEHRDEINGYSSSLHAIHHWLTQFNGMGEFISGQIIADAKFTPWLERCLDWWEFAVPGPGSRRGLARVTNRPVDYRWDDSEWRVELLKLKALISPYVELDFKYPKLSAQDLQNCLCEFDKYERVRLGEGRPRNNYSGV